METHGLRGRADLVVVDDLVAFTGPLVCLAAVLPGKKLKIAGRRTSKLRRPGEYE
jgi:hypothetical protein